MQFRRVRAVNAKKAAYIDWAGEATAEERQPPPFSLRSASNADRLTFSFESYPNSALISPRVFGCQ